MQVRIGAGNLGCCGLSDVALAVIYDVEQSPQNRTRSRRGAGAGAWVPGGGKEEKGAGARE